MTSPLLRFITTVRYRFFLLAGLIPYFLGFSISYWQQHKVNVFTFILGLIGIVLMVTGVETYNEYFDPADRVFILDEKKKPSISIFILGTVAFVIAISLAIYLSFLYSFIILYIVLAGTFFAVFYVGPPLRLAFRGLGELSIFLSYGPLMTLGSYYLQTFHLSIVPILVSLVPGFIVVAIAIANEIPDYYQDLLSGKRDIAVRVGTKNAVVFYAMFATLSLIILIINSLLRIAPLASLIGLFTAPLIYSSVRTGYKYHEKPKLFIPAIRNLAISYLVVSFILILTFLFS